MWVSGAGVRGIPCRAGEVATSGGCMKIAYLINTIYGIGGTVRTVANQAAALSARHEVEIVSVFQHRDDPVLPVPPKVRLRPLVDVRLPAGEGTGEDGRRLHEGSERAGLSPRLFPVEDPLSHAYSRLTDDRIEEFLATTDADVVVGTRPGLNVALARSGPEGAAKVGQEHLTYGQHSPELRRVLARDYLRLDAFVTVTEADVRTYAEQMPLPGVRLCSVPNAVPAPAFTADGRDHKIIASAGRLAPSKRHDLLVQAFAEVADDHPDWTLRIYGRGGRYAALKRLIAASGLQDRVLLMGAHPRVEEAWAQASFAAVTSSEEPFGMTIVEAMRSGLPVVSTDCPHGPASIIRDGEDGLLVPNRSVRGIAEGLARLMGDDGARRRMAAAALRNSDRFDPARVVRMHEELFAELTGHRLSHGVSAVRPAEPAGCRVVARRDGAAVLSFTRPPDAVALVRDGARVELAPDGEGRVLVHPDEPALEGGTWEVHRVDGADTTRVDDVDIDQRDHPLDPERVERLALAVPARDGHRRLVLHVRRSEHHAEVERVESGGGTVTVRGRVLGQRGADPGARLVLRLRGDRSVVREFPAPIGEGGGFTAVVDPETVVGDRNGLASAWEARLHRSDAAPCTLGRHLPGVVGCKKIIEYPPEKVGFGHGWDACVRVYYTVNDRLAFTSGPAADAVALDDLSVRWSGWGADRLVMNGEIDGLLPDEARLWVEIVEGAGQGRRIPLRVRRTRDGGLVEGVFPCAELVSQRPVRANWRFRLLVNVNGSTARVGARAVPDHRRRRWSRGPYVRSATMSPLNSGDLELKVADVHLGAAISRRAG